MPPKADPKHYFTPLGVWPKSASSVPNRAVSPVRQPEADAGNLSAALLSVANGRQDAQIAFYDALATYQHRATNVESFLTTVYSWNLEKILPRLLQTLKESKAITALELISAIPKFDQDWKERQAKDGRRIWPSSEKDNMAKNGKERLGLSEASCSSGLALPRKRQNNEISKPPRAKELNLNKQITMENDDSLLSVVKGSRDNYDPLKISKHSRAQDVDCTKRDKRDKKKITMANDCLLKAKCSRDNHVPPQISNPSRAEDVNRRDSREKKQITMANDCLLKAKCSRDNHVPPQISNPSRAEDVNRRDSREKKQITMANDCLLKAKCSRDNHVPPQISNPSRAEDVNRRDSREKKQITMANDCLLKAKCSRDNHVPPQISNPSRAEDVNRRDSREKKQISNPSRAEDVNRRDSREKKQISNPSRAEDVNRRDSREKKQV